MEIGYSHKAIESKWVLLKKLSIMDAMANQNKTALNSP